MRVLPVILAAFALGASPAAADDLLLFQSGHTLEVSSWRFDGDWLYLELPTGGIVCPRAVLFEAKHLDRRNRRYVSAWRADRDVFVVEAPVPDFERPRPEAARLEEPAGTDEWPDEAVFDGPDEEPPSAP